jgi:uncharacterized OB-fold protein
VSQPARDEAARQLPALDPETAFFWTAGAEGRLMISRCQACERWQHPPLPRCPSCGGEPAPQAVSGRGRVAAFTVNQQAWLPGMAVPFVFAAVELAEQRELYVFSNVTGCPPEAVRTGLSVQVRFEQHDDVWLPMFQPVEDDHAG